MRTVFHSKVIWLICLLATAVLSFFCIAPHMTQPSTYQTSLDALQGKQETVLELTAVSAAAFPYQAMNRSQKRTPWRVKNRTTEKSTLYINHVNY